MQHVRAEELIFQRLIVEVYEPSCTENKTAIYSWYIFLNRHCGEYAISRVTTHAKKQTHITAISSDSFLFVFRPSYEGYPRRQDESGKREGRRRRAESGGEGYWEIGRGEEGARDAYSEV